MKHRAIVILGVVLLTLITGGIIVAASPYPSGPSGELSGEAGNSSPLTGGSCEIAFSDVMWGSTFYPYVQCLACRSVLGGYADGTFRPSNNVTRGQLSKIVSNAAGLGGIPAGQSFQDVPSGSTFFDYVQALSSKGYISGYTCGGAGEPCVLPGNRPYFRPGNNATRGQISKIVANAVGLNDTPAGQTFADVPPSHSFYVWIERMAATGAINGYACGGSGEPCSSGNRPYFRASNNATRGQLAKIVSNSFSPHCYSTQNMIADALQAGRIDYGTSLLYRAYALFGDRRLPPDYTGDGSSGQDGGLFYEATVLSNTIPPNILAQI